MSTVSRSSTNDCHMLTGRKLLVSLLRLCVCVCICVCRGADGAQGEAQGQFQETGTPENLPVLLLILGARPLPGPSILPSL